MTIPDYALERRNSKIAPVFKFREIAISLVDFALPGGFAVWEAEG